MGNLNAEGIQGYAVIGEVEIAGKSLLTRIGDILAW